MGVSDPHLIQLPSIFCTCSKGADFYCLSDRYISAHCLLGNLQVYTDADGHRQRKQDEGNSPNYEHEVRCLWFELLYHLALGNHCHFPHRNDHIRVKRVHL